MKQIIVGLDGESLLMYSDVAPKNVAVGTEFNIKGVRGKTTQKVRCTAIVPNPNPVATHGRHLRETMYVVERVLA